MDVGKLAQDVTAALAPCLPLLTTAGQELAKNAATKVGQKTLELAGSLWGKIRDKLAGRPGAAEVVKAVAAAPDDAAARGALEFQLRQLLQADPDLAGELARLLAAAPRNVTASGVRSVAIGGDADNSIIVTGDNNRTGQGYRG